MHRLGTSRYTKGERGGGERERERERCQAGVNRRIERLDVFKL